MSTINDFDARHPNAGITRESSARKSEVIDASTTHGLSCATRGIYIGGDGDLKVQLIEDLGYVTFLGVKGGSILPLEIIAIHSDTTATGLIGLR